VPASVRVVALIGDHPQPELVVGGWLLMALATVAGAWLAGRDRGPREAWLGAAAGALLVIAGLHLLPDAWSAAGAAGIWQPLVPAVALGSFVVSGLAARRGCGCRPGRGGGNRRAAVAALTLHRFLEGSALAVAGSVVVAAALAVHALAEGVAAGALLSSQTRRRVIGWLAAMCLGPAAGAVTASAWLLPATARPVLLAAAAGVLAQAARISLDAVSHAPAARRLAPRTAAVVLAGAAVTAVAAHVVG